MQFNEFIHTIILADERPSISTTTLKTGWVLALHYADQMTGSSANVMNLQCFVGQHIGAGVKVVEPFLYPKGSWFGVSFSALYSSPETVRLRDILDISEWDHYARLHGYAPLISWKNFIDNGPRKLILVHRTSPENDCREDNIMANATKEFVIANKFEIVRRICINFTKTGMLSPSEFIDIVYGAYSPNEVVVIFNTWGGAVDMIRDNYRYGIKETPCNRGKEYKHLVQHSEQILNDTKKYVTQYMNKTDHYLAVMVRLERFILSNDLKGLSSESLQTRVDGCLNEIHYAVKILRNKRNIKQILLTMDIGKYGTKGFSKKSKDFDVDVVNKTGQQLFEILFKNSLTQDVWEDSFDRVAHFTDPGYVAILQQELAADSVCLVLAGGGSFQRAAERLYEQKHTSLRKKCVYHVC